MRPVRAWIKQISRARDVQTANKLIVSAVKDMSSAPFVTLLTEDDWTELEQVRLLSEQKPEETFFNITSNDVTFCNPLNSNLFSHQSATVIPIRDEIIVGVILVGWDLSTDEICEGIEPLLILAECSLIVLQNVNVHVQLAKQMAERTSLLAAARQEAEMANQLQSRFLSAASHDLRQPLQQINSLIEILIRQSQNSQSVAQLTRIKRIIGDMNLLLNSLLNLDRLEKGVIEPSLKNIQTADLLNALKNDFSLQAAEKGLHLAIESATGTVISDKGLLLQILRNIVGNAIKYTLKGEIKISTTRGSDFLMINIQDSGPGIAPDRQAFIFDPFSQIDHYNEITSGFGLGLSLVKALAETLNHPISLVSEVGSGSIFSVRLPVHNEAVQEHDAQVKSILELPEHNSCVVLYLEDDDDLANSISTLLTMTGYKVITAGSSMEARQAMVIAKETPDIIVTDNTLDAGENGVEVVTQIRKETETQIPAIMLTGYTESAVHNKALKVVQKVLSKPVDADDLLSEIDAIQQQRS